MYRKIIFRITIFCSLLMVLSSCKEEVKAPDVSHIQAEFEWIRFDSLYFNLQDSNGIEKITETYPAFSSILFDQIFRIPQTHTRQLFQFTQTESMKAIHDSCQIRLGDINRFKKDFEETYRYYLYYFPASNPPDIYTCITEFSLATFLFLDENDEDAIGLSLDMFLGGDFPYERISPEVTGFYEYVNRAFNTDHMVKKVMETLVKDKLTPARDRQLLDLMIENGKILYALKQLMPHAPDSVVFEHTAAQTQWLKENEVPIWGYILDKDLLYNRTMSDIATLIRPAPHSKGMPPEAPGQAANYIGYKIIDAYMKQTQTSLKDLLSTSKDAQTILDESKYRPRS